MDNDDGYQPQGQDYPYPYSIPQSSGYDYQDYDTGHVVFHDLDKKENVVKSKAQPVYPSPAPVLYSIPQPAHPGKTYPVHPGKFFRAPPHPYHGPQINQHTGQTSQPAQDSAKPKAKRGRRKKKTNESSDQLGSCTNTKAVYLQVQPGMSHHGNRLGDTSEKNHESSSTTSQKSIPDHPPNLDLDTLKTVGTQSLQSYPPTPQPVSFPDHPPNSIVNMRLDSIYYRTMDVENIREEDIDLNLLEGDDLELDDSMEEKQAGPAQPEVSNSTLSNGSSSGQNTNTPSPASIHDHHEPPNSILNRIPATPASLHDHPPNSILNMRLDSIYYRTMDVENIGEEDIDLNLLEGDDDIDLDAMDTEDQTTDSEDKCPKQPQGDCPVQAATMNCQKSMKSVSAKRSQKLTQNPISLPVCTTPIQNSSTPSPTSMHEQSSEQAPIQNRRTPPKDMKETPIPASIPANFPDHPPNSILNMRLDSVYFRTMDVENITEEDINLNLLEGDDLDFENMDSSDKHQAGEVPAQGVIQNTKGDSNFPAASKKHQKTIATESEASTSNQHTNSPLQNSIDPFPAPPTPAGVHDHPPNSILNMKLDSIYYRTMDLENIGEEDIDLNLLEGDDIDLDETPEEPVLPTKQNESVQSESVQKPSSIQSTSSHDIGSSGNNITLSSSEAMKSTNTHNNPDSPITHTPATPASLHDHPPNSIMNMRLDSIYFRTMDVENIREDEIDLNLLEGDDIDLDDLGDKEPQEKICKNTNTETRSNAAAPLKITQKSVKKQTELGAPPTPANVHDHPPNSIMNMRLDSVYFRTIDVENITEEDINLNLLEGDDDIDLDAMDPEASEDTEGVSIRLLKVPALLSRASNSKESPSEANPAQAITKKSAQKESEAASPLLDSDPKSRGSQKNSECQKIPEHPPNSIMNLRLDSIYYRTMDVENITEEDVNLNLLMGDDDIDLEGVQKDNPRPESRNQSLEDKNVGEQQQGKSSKQTLETRGRHMEYLDLDTMKTVGTQSLQSFPPTPQPAYLPPDYPPNSIMNLRLDSVYYRTMDVENIREEDAQVDILEKDGRNLEELGSEESDSEDPKSPTKQLQRHNKNSTSPSSNITSSSEESESDENDDESSEDEEEEEDVVVSIIKKAPKRNKSQILSGLCSNCSVKESTYWRKNKDGKQVCNPCALYEKTTGVKRPESLWQKEINRRDGTIDKELQIKKKENKEKRKRACIICEKSCRSVRNPPLCIPCRKGTANTAMECSVCGEGGKKLATYYFVKGKAECYRCYEKKINRKSKEGMARIAAEKEKARKEAEAKAKEIEHIFAVPQLPTDKPRCHKCAVSGVRLVKSPLFEGSPLTCRKCYEAAYRKKKRSEKPPVPPKPKENHECVKCGATGVKMEKIDPVTKARTCKKCYNREMYLRNKEKKMKEGR